MKEEDLNYKMEKAISHLEKDFQSIRTSRANLNMLDNIFVEAYGSKSALNQLGNISVPDSSTLSIQVWDAGLIKSVEKALLDSNLGINPLDFQKYDIHVHVPEGATPKDGPSAGIAMVTSIVSSITGIPVDKNIAMTGEVTLRGHVLPIGGLKEKLLAAHRARISKILIPEDNKKDLVEIPKNILKDLEITTVKTVDEVLKIALIKELKPVEWIEIENLPKSKSGEKTAPGSTH